MIADYHWFNDWGRDTLMALPGLTRYAREAQQVKASLQKFGNGKLGYLYDRIDPDDKAVSLG